MSVVQTASTPVAILRIVFENQPLYMTQFVMEMVKPFFRLLMSRVIFDLVILGEYLLLDFLHIKLYTDCKARVRFLQSASDFEFP